MPNETAELFLQGVRAPAYFNRPWNIGMPSLGAGGWHGLV
jgi:hypothetical protein